MTFNSIYSFREQVTKSGVSQWKPKVTIMHISFHMSARTKHIPLSLGPKFVSSSSTSTCQIILHKQLTTSNDDPKKFISKRLTKTNHGTKMYHLVHYERLMNTYVIAQHSSMVFFQHVRSLPNTL